VKSHCPKSLRIYCAGRYKEIAMMHLTIYITQTEKSRKKDMKLM
jgi:hypothetical protein